MGKTYTRENSGAPAIGSGRLWPRRLRWAAAGFALGAAVWPAVGLWSLVGNGAVDEPVGRAMISPAMAQGISQRWAKVPGADDPAAARSPTLVANCVTLIRRPSGAEPDTASCPPVALAIVEGAGRSDFARSEQGSGGESALVAADDAPVDPSAPR